MPHRVNRAEFLSRLEAVAPGLSSKEILEQSSCFVFQNGHVITYNDEVSCRTQSGMPKDFVGAAKALPLLNILRKFPEDEVAIEATEGEIRVHGKRRGTGIKMEETVTLPFGNVERPNKEKWRELPARFGDALAIVQECAGRDQDDFALTCVHITPNCVEATDAAQIARYKLKTGFAGKFLVRKEAVKHIVELGMTHVNETESWVHFKSPAGVWLSVRRFTDNYPELDEYLQMGKSSPVTLPKGLAAEAENAAIFSAENTDNNNLIVQLVPGKVRIKGTGVSGWYSAWKSVKYAGKPMKFVMSPKVLTDIVTKHNDAQVNKDKLLVDGGGWTYVTVLGVPEEAPKPEMKGEDAE